MTENEIERQENGELVKEKIETDLQSALDKLKADAASAYRAVVQKQVCEMLRGLINWSENGNFRFPEDAFQQFLADIWQLSVLPDEYVISYPDGTSRVVHPKDEYILNDNIYPIYGDATHVVYRLGQDWEGASNWKILVDTWEEHFDE
jgi:hypothetical protein